MTRLFSCVFLLGAMASHVSGQATGSIRGTITDAKTHKPVAAALVIAVKTTAPPVRSRDKTGGDGNFQLGGLPAGSYTVCVQAGEQYLDPCQWGGTPATITLAAGQNVSGTAVALSAASLVNIQVEDPANALNLTTAAGRKPNLRVGVMGPKGFFYPARQVGTAVPSRVHPGGSSYSYRLAAPPDTSLNLSVGSGDLKLGDQTGLALANNASALSFLNASANLSPQSFTFTVLGLLP